MTNLTKAGAHPQGQDSSISRRSFLLKSGATAITTSLFLSSCSNLFDKVFKGSESKRDQTLAFFGDSLTLGTGGSVAYGTRVAASFPGRQAVTDAIRGQIALSISIRQGGTPLIVTIDKDAFNGIEPVRVTKRNNDFLSNAIDFNEYKRTGTLAGVKCTIIRRASADQGEIYTVVPDVASTVAVPPDSVFELDEAVKLKTATQIFWYGRNNIGKSDAQSEILTALEKSVAFVEAPARYLVLGVLPAVAENIGTENWNRVFEINSKIAARFGKNYVAMTPPTDEEMAAVGYTPNDDDKQAIARRNFPRGLRPADLADGIHLNDKGYEVVANRVIAKLKELDF